MECYSSVLSVKCVDNVQICYIVIDFSVYILSYIERRLEISNSSSGYVSLFAVLSVFAFCHNSGVIFISEVIDISPSNLDSSLCFSQYSICHDVLCIELNKHGDNIQP